MFLTNDPVGLFGYSTIVISLTLVILAVLYKFTKNIRAANGMALGFLVVVIGALILALFVFVLLGAAIK